MINSYHYEGDLAPMGKAIKKTISLPAELAEEVEEVAREERKTVSAVIQEALRITRKERLRKEFYQIQGYWCSKAREKGILSEDDLERYLKS